MKTLVLGYADDKGRGKPSVVCLPDVPPADQIKVLSDAKQNQQFPEGIVRLELCVFETRTIAIEIPKSDDSKKPKSKKSK